MNILRIENSLAVATVSTGFPTYDFNFDLYFTTSHPYELSRDEKCVMRVGPIADYAALYNQIGESGPRLVNSPEEHERASDLEKWYPIIEDLTPRSRVFPRLPEAEVAEENFGWPVFVKGVRQTSKHDSFLSVITSSAQYAEVVQRYIGDPILHWQKAVLREYIPLAPVVGGVPGKVPASMEFRSFWWMGRCVGVGRYWYQVPVYDAPDLHEGIALASEAARRLAVPFLVVDFAKTLAGRWIVIECNDAQESGYAAVSPYDLWQRVLAAICED